MEHGNAKVAGKIRWDPKERLKLDKIPFYPFPLLSALHHTKLIFHSRKTPTPSPTKTELERKTLMYHLTIAKALLREISASLRLQSAYQVLQKGMG